jgi:beta-xylosidase
LPGAQLPLLFALLNNATAPVVVILTHGRPVTFGSDYGGSLTSRYTSGGLAPLDQRAAAVLATWRPGEEGGSAMWQLLTGAASPSGRLPQAWPVSVGGVRIGGVGDYLIKYSTQGGEGWTLGAPFAPNYPFGFGLDYLDVSLGTVSALVDAAALLVNVTVEVHNAAQTSGLYVVEVRAEKEGQFRAEQTACRPRR